MILDRRAKRTAANAWIDSIDPLNGLSIAQSRAVFNAARRHGSPLLQKIYAEVEASDPVLMTCVERRASALACLGWRAVADASAPDPDAAERQRLALEAFADGIGNLDEAIEHLDLAFFRGFSVVQPVWDGGAVRGIALLDTWNFLFGADGALLWNPGCSPDPADCEEVGPEARVVALRRRRCIDWPALAAFLRKYVGERDWGRFLERYGVPPVDAVMGAGATEAQREDYVDAADAARDGRSVVWPTGTIVSRAEGARGQDPFTAFVEHQEKMIVLMATGGTLTSLAQADTGSLAGGAQMDVWEQIVSRDGVAIAGALNRDLFLPFLRARFPGERPMARIVLGREAEPTADEAAGLAGKLRAAGYIVDQSQLEESTGFRLEKDPSGGAGGPPGGGFGGVMNKAAPQTPLQTLAKPLQNAGKGGGGEIPPPGPPARLDAILGDFSERLEEEMAEEMFAAAAAGLKDEGRSTEGEGGDPALNAITNPCPKCHWQMSADGTCSFCAKRQANHEAGKKAFAEVEKNHVDVMGAMERDSIGKIDFIWGDDTEGICHIVGKHPGDAAMIPGVIAYGDVYEDDVNGKFYCIKKRNLVVLRKGNGRNHYLITGYAKEDAHATAKIRKECKLVEKGE